jgi:hypothetical protein
MTNEANQDKWLSETWQERVKYLIARFELQVDDLHRSYEWVIKRAYILSFAAAILFAIGIACFSDNLLLLAPFLGLMAGGAFCLRGLVAPATVKSRGFTPGLIGVSLDEQKVVTGFEPHAYFLSEDTADEVFYAWIVSALQDQCHDICGKTLEIAKMYREAEALFIMAFVYLLSLKLLGAIASV